MTVTIKKGDTRTAIAANLKSPKGNPVDLTGTEVRFKMLPTRRNYLNKPVRSNCSAYIDREALIMDAEAGRVAFVFEPGETDQRGIMYGEFKVTYVDGSIETFPNSGYIIINIE